MDQVRLKKKIVTGTRKETTFEEVGFFLSTSGIFFDLLNIIIWTFSPTDNLSKINFFSQAALNRAIFIDGLKVTDQRVEQGRNCQCRRLYIG